MAGPDSQASPTYFILGSRYLPTLVIEMSDLIFFFSSIQSTLYLKVPLQEVCFQDILLITEISSWSKSWCV